MKLKASLIFCSITLSLFGILMIYSASVYSANLQFKNPYFYVQKQALAFAVGLVMMFFAAKIKLSIIKKTAVTIYIFSLVLLALVFVPGLGMTSYGATRWINLGFITFQPSEIAKFGLVIFLAYFLEKYPPTSLKKIFFPLSLSLTMCVLIMMEPNLSITMCVLLTTVAMLFIGGMKSKHLALMGGGIGITLPVLIIAEPYRMKRLLAFIDPWANPKAEGYQLIQSYYALGNGGLFGVGLFNSRQKYLFLPFAESDFIFSIIAEELGLFGCIATIALFAILVVSGITVAIRAKDKFSMYLGFGISTIIAVQTIINIAVVTGSIPPTGLPLPFISAGGSSLMVFMFAIGLLLNICGQSTKRQKSHTIY